MAEMASATVALVLLAATGVSVATLIATLVATGLLAISRVLYHGRQKFRNHG